MRAFFISFFIVIGLFANTKENMLNDIKALINQEENIALAVNKYVLINGKVPPTTKWEDFFEALKDDGFLPANFNQINNFTKKEFEISNNKGNIFIKGLFSDKKEYKDEYKFLYNLYADNKFRVNTFAPKSNSGDELVIGSQIKYAKVQKEIVEILNLPASEKKDILLSNQNCTKNKYFYELANEKLEYYYCKDNQNKLKVFQTSPIFLEDKKDLEIIQVNIGDSAYVQDGDKWKEHFFYGDGWKEIVLKTVGSSLPSGGSDESEIEEAFNSYLAAAKDFYIRQGGGCYLGNGDIYCWGRNDNKQAGIQNYGQSNLNLSPDYTNTPVMLKTQKPSGTTYYNSPNRVKFVKMSMNISNICGVSTSEDLYCNGAINSQFFDTSIAKSAEMRKLIKLDGGGTPPKFIDVAMVEDIIVLLDKDGKLYSMGKNYSGALGVNKTDQFFTHNGPKLISTSTSPKFKKIFGLRDSRTFGALTEDNRFFIWGERQNTNENIYLPTSIGVYNIDENKIFVNSNEFIIYSNKKYYVTSGTTSTSDISTTNDPLDGDIASLAYLDSKNLLYLESKELKGASSLLECKNADGTKCANSSKSKQLFDYTFDTLRNISKDNNYSGFSNIALYKLDHVLFELYEHFEIASGWNKMDVFKDSNGNIYLGQFPSGSGTLSKTYDFGTANRDKTVTISFDFHQIGTWGHTFKVYSGYEECLTTTFSTSTKKKKACIKDGGSAEIHKLSYNATLDSYGKITVNFSSDIDGKKRASIISNPTNNEAWGIGNIKIVQDSTILSHETFNTTSAETLSGWEKNNSNNVFSALTSTDLTSVPFDKSDAEKDREPATTYLGKFPLNFSCSNKNPCPSDIKPFTVRKIYKFPEYAGHEVELEFEFYEIDSWDGERFEFWANGEKLATDHFVRDNHDYLLDSNISGVSLQRNIGTIQGENPQKYTYKLRAKIDNNGDLKLEFRTNLEFNGDVKDANGRFDKNGNPIYGNYWSKFDEGIANESWGIDNIRIRIKEKDKYFACAMTGLEQNSQMYCWGDVARSLPFLNTSLYDVNKISTINELFVTPNTDLNQSKYYDENFNGKLFLKYPTYIFGFDYPFNFR